MLNALDRVLDDRRDVRVTVWTPRLPIDAPAWRNLRIETAGRLRGHLWEQLELPVLSRGRLLFCPGNTAPIVSLLGLQRTVVTVHDLSYSYFPEAYSRAFRLWYNIVVPLALRRAAAIVTVSETERDSIVRHFPAVAARIHAVANGGWPQDQLPRDAGAGRESGLVLYVGSLSKRKNFPRMLEVAIRLARKRALRFCFVGGTAAALAPSGLGVPADVAHLISLEGQVNDIERLAAYYHRATCFLFPSLYESSGLPPAEAMACGCPVIASDTAALRERCADAALYCDPNDTAAIEAAVERLVDSATLQQSLREAGYRRAAQTTWAACARATLGIIAQCLENGR